ncbi:hypothetical protein PILCRDRAFT_829466 [Piloderma croceum F 1598]|uniref:Uncharacterized protein n=1 Tax=Piloderma croceum (strain F 1598) TaxID=765440 RepID=A0A0C3EJX7_PILCF|nr:hypothetical protein PILCRDRAFT_829466 [Piloderma croceum F 1598]
MRPTEYTCSTSANNKNEHSGCSNSRASLLLLLQRAERIRQGAFGGVKDIQINVLHLYPREDNTYSITWFNSPILLFGPSKPRSVSHLNY